jgi:hypothetical protein
LEALYTSFLVSKCPVARCDSVLSLPAQQNNRMADEPTNTLKSSKPSLPASPSASMPKRRNGLARLIVHCLLHLNLEFTSDPRVRVDHPLDHSCLMRVSPEALFQSRERADHPLDIDRWVRHRRSCGGFQSRERADHPLDYGPKWRRHLKINVSIPRTGRSSLSTTVALFPKHGGLSSCWELNK